MPSHPELAFFNDLSGILKIELSEPPQQSAPNLLNLKAPPTARLVRVRLELGVFDGDAIRPLTDDELATIAFVGSRIRLRSDGEGEIDVAAPNGASFTVRELAQAIEKAELELRPSSEWDGGIDVHHIFFEGLHEEADGSWFIAWGS